MALFEMMLICSTAMLRMPMGFLQPCLGLESRTHAVGVGNSLSSPWAVLTQILRGLIGMCSVTESKRCGSAGPSLRDQESGLRWSLGVTMALVEWIVSLKPFIHLGVNLCF